MRVWELAAELGKKTSELVAELQELGFAVTAAASGLSDEEAEAIRKAYAALEPTAPSDAARTESEGRGRARGRSSVSARRGGSGGGDHTPRRWRLRARAQGVDLGGRRRGAEERNDS